jgi:hypothetical protein
MSAPVKGRLPPDASVSCDAVRTEPPDDADDADPPAAFVTGARVPPLLPVCPPVDPLPPPDCVDTGAVVGG